MPNDLSAPADEPTERPFRPLGEYDWPSTPVDRGLSRVIASLKKRFLASNDENGLDLPRLEPIESTLLDDIVAPPANEPLMLEMEATLADWLSDPDAVPNVQVIVLPPCDEDDFVRGWAESRALPIIDSPGREADELPDIVRGDGAVTVVPRLEEWFLREHSALVNVRTLIRRMDAASGSGQRFLVGCNSWAWQFLVKSCGIDALFPEPLTFAAFDGPRLHRWLKRLADDEDGNRRLTFRSAGDGRDAFAGTFDEGEDEAGTMSELAERSLGIPWVAWNLWRASLRTSADGGGGDENEDGKGAGEGRVDLDGDDAETLWITELRDFALPDRKNQDALLMLHTLLLHGSLTEEEIFRTVPVDRYTNALGALVKAGLVRRAEGGYVCVPAAYPAIRDGLSVAGFPMDVL